MSIVVSNTSDHQVSATVKLETRNGKDEESLTLPLGPHQTRVLSAREFGGEKHEPLMEIGGISIIHNGAPGTLFAESLVKTHRLAIRRFWTFAIHRLRFPPGSTAGV
jgi:hypothetical protein